MSEEKKTRPISEEHKERIKKIGEKIRMLRKEVEPNYETFAFKNGINRMSYFNVEKGNNIQLSTLLKILDGLDISLEEFFKGIK
ncbi:MAG: helix-turn-helix transcriptional regulator [Cyclobacteriaceae bacterium]|nr:helix-turn-helix transcriptional regulator [Cyclobacteriaceae bacterium]